LNALKIHLDGAIAVTVVRCLFIISAFCFHDFCFALVISAFQRFQPVSIIRANSRNSRRKFQFSAFHLLIL